MDHHMHLQGIPPPNRLHAFLQESAARKDLISGRRVHSLLIACGLSSATSIGDHLVRFFLLCGSFLEANLAFVNIKIPAVQTWQVIIETHAEFQERKRAIELLFLMQHEGLIPNRATYVCILKVCGSIKALEEGSIVHEKIKTYGIISNIQIASSLIDMYAKCGNLSKAQEVYQELPHQNVISYNAMISAYARHGYQSFAMQSFQKMQIEGFLPDEVSYMYVIKAFTHAREIIQGRKIHNQVLLVGAEMNLVIGSSLVDFYCKCVSLEDAQNVFDKLACKDVILWCTMIVGYIENDHGIMALQLFSQMEQNGIKLDKVAFSATLKACSVIGALEEARLVHDLIIKHQLESDPDLGTALINIYARCGIMEDACMIFDGLEKRNVVSWSAIISGYLYARENSTALSLFEKMHKERINPNITVFACVLNACSGIGALPQGMVIHELVMEAGFESHMMLSNCLINMYAKCGKLEEAYKVFEYLPHYQDGASWGVIIEGYVNHGNSTHALQLFRRMLQLGVIPDRVTLLSVMKGCCNLGSLRNGMLMHHISIESDFANDTSICNTLVDMYAKCGALEEAHNSFSMLPHQGVVSWTALIAAYTENGQPSIALELFNKILVNNLDADRSMFLSLLKTSCDTECISSVMIAHDRIMKSAYSSDIFIENLLIDVYVKLGAFDEACKVFNKKVAHDSVSYSSLIAGYLMHGHGDNALELFEKMQQERIELSKIASTCALNACGILKDIRSGRLVHFSIIENGLEVDIEVGVALVHMCMKCASLEDACHAFNYLPYQNQVSWSVMVAGYVQHAHYDLALLLFERMQLQGMKPNAVVLSSAVKACASIGALHQGQWIHDQVIRNGFEFDDVVGSGLVDMYVKCGSSKEASKVFDELPCKDPIAWSAITAGFADMGDLALVEKCVQRMRQQGLNPDGSIYRNFLSACSHSGQVDEGSIQFKYMLENKAVIPTAVHFNSLAHLFGCSGELHMAHELLECMPTEPDFIGQTSLLAVSMSYGNIIMAGQLFEEIVSLEPKTAVANALMSNV